MERPIRLSLAAPLRELPPMLQPEAGMASVLWWSLRTRYWVWRVPQPQGPAPDIKLLVLYHDPARSSSLPHSIGLQKGLFGIVDCGAAPTILHAVDEPTHLRLQLIQHAKFGSTETRTTERSL